MGFSTQNIIKGSEHKQDMKIHTKHVSPLVFDQLY
jgi:hypothetical protein